MVGSFRFTSAMDLGCAEKKSNQASIHLENCENESVLSISKLGKITKQISPPIIGALNRLSSQVKKPPHRRGSPVQCWIPRKKVDSYLKRKIQLLQEEDGMKATLDETLGDSNLHYSKLLREKIAVQEAASKAILTRKSAMVEKSWCRILQAARIQCKEAEEMITETEKNAEQALESATSIGVILYNSDCSRKNSELETTTTTTTTAHTIADSSLETAFEVDRQVSAAIRTALIKLANCPSISKHECKELLSKISQTPDLDNEITDFSDEALSDEEGIIISDEFKKKSNVVVNLVDQMLERLIRLQEDELILIANIVATSGLNAALGRNNHQEQQSRRISTFGGTTRKNQGELDVEIPSLDKFLVKRLTKLERDILKAKNEPSRRVVSSRKNQAELDLGRTPSLDKILIRRLTKLEKDIEEAKNKRIEMIPGKENIDINSVEMGSSSGLDEILIKRKSRLEREKDMSKEDDNVVVTSRLATRREARMREVQDAWGGLSLGNSMVRPHLSRLEREKAAWRKAEEEEEEERKKAMEV